MTTKEVADRLVELCGKGDFESAQSDLFADDAVSIEPYSTPDFEKETKEIKEAAAVEPQQQQQSFWGNQTKTKAKMKPMLSQKKRN